MTGIPVRLSFPRLLPVLAGLMTFLATACGAAATPMPSQPAGSGDDALTPILATTILRVGTQRVSFLLASPEALVKAPEATVTTRFLEGDGAVSETTQAVFHPWPYGVRGSYSTDLTFDQPGRWQLDISVNGADFSGETQLVVEVAEEAVVPDIGAIPPLSRTKTLESAGGFKTLTTDSSPDPDLYLLTIEEAVKDPRPDVIVFATPAFCTSATCGPQVDTVSKLKDAYRDEANFIHVEIYDNPGQIQGDLSKAKLAPAVSEWGFDQIPGWFNESWTYVLNSEGRIEQKFEGFVTLAELEETLQQALKKS